MKKFISTSIIDFLKENNDIVYKRTKMGNIEAIFNNEIVGELSLNDYWTEIEYIDDPKIKDSILIPNDFEFVSMINSEIENKGIATNMLKHALETTKKQGIAISKLFIAEESIHYIMKKLNATSIPDWYLIKKSF